MQIVAVCGSLRAKSYNRMLLHELSRLAEAGVQVEIADLHGIPVYDGDLEDRGMPGAVTALQDRIAGAAGLILGSPEYNGGVPGPLKNAIDWCTRGGRMREVFARKPTAVVGATPGGSGTRLAQQAWLQTFRQLGVEAYFAKALYVSGAGGVFDADGAMIDDTTRAHCQAFIDDFAAFVRARH